MKIPPEMKLSYQTIIKFPNFMKLSFLICTSFSYKKYEFTFLTEILIQAANRSKASIVPSRTVDQRLDWAQNVAGVTSIYT